MLDAVASIAGRVGEALDRRFEFVVGGGDRETHVGVPVVGRCESSSGGDADASVGCGVKKGVVVVGADPEEGPVVVAFVAPFGKCSASEARACARACASWWRRCAASASR